MIKTRIALCVLASLLVSACTTKPEVSSSERLPATIVPVETLVVEEVPDSEVTQALATDFEMIFIDQDMSFIGTLPCADCPGIAFHLNLFRDGRFEIRQEYLERNDILLVKGTWLLEQRTLHLMNQQHTLPTFQFVSNHRLTMLDMAGKPIVSSLNYHLDRASRLQTIDTRRPMLGLYRVNGDSASFTQCDSGERYQVAMTQHHMPMLRNYRQDPQLSGKAVIATLTGRLGNGNDSSTLFIDQFEQFWPGASCPQRHAPTAVQGVVWRAEKIADQYVPQHLNVRVLFRDNDTLYGFSGCNNFHASYRQRANTLQVSPLAMTRKFCEESSRIETAFTERLQTADRAEVNGNALQLFKDNQVIMQLVPAAN
ncbi:META domain-containing protein [Alkalimonas sp.]|uniref:META domain-containing protein n=1 Tax=Alkalimonas sp. TaxID=1872453 RepID=UPI00263AF8A7|nr:META domain-containing protein [Alkalimonas sp.]MCC5824730.1 META domain-containing protein [Alkalimonas sp.]